MIKEKKLIVLLVTVGLISTFSLSGLQAGERLNIPHQDWPGTYEGRMDGRRARLTIETKWVGESAHAVRYKIVLEELDRGGTFSGEVYVNYNQTPLHVIQFNKPLKSKSGNKKDVKRLLLHTWDIDYISGYSTWQGKDYGLSFERVS